MRSYGQWCAVAKALDVVGERWTLLVVRELLAGPSRYTDLRDQIPGIATDVLAARLKDLEEWGVVARRTLPPPAASKVYELTELGRELTPVVHSLAMWGMQLLDTPRGDEAFRPHWLALALRGLLRSDITDHKRLDIDFVLGSDEVVRIRVEKGSLRYVEDAPEDADVTIRADLGTLADLARGSLSSSEATAAGRLEVRGSREATRAYARLFSEPVRA